MLFAKLPQGRNFSPQSCSISYWHTEATGVRDRPLGINWVAKCVEELNLNLKHEEIGFQKSWLTEHVSY